MRSIRSGCSATSSLANRCLDSGSSGVVQRMSIRMLRPSVHPSFWSPSRNAATRACASGSLSGYPISAPIRRIPLDCCARAAHGHAAAAKPNSLMKSRRRIRPRPRATSKSSTVTWTIPDQPPTRPDVSPWHAAAWVACDSLSAAGESRRASLATRTQRNLLGARPPAGGIPSAGLRMPFAAGRRGHGSVRHPQHRLDGRSLRSSSCAAWLISASG